MNNNIQPYKYGGKEDEPMHGLGLYDSGARYLNYRDIPYTLTMDPLAEKYYNISPYAWCAGNPVNRIDPTGMDWVEDENGNVIWKKEYTKDNVPEGYKYIGESYKGFSISQTYTNHTNKTELTTRIYYKNEEGEKKDIGGWVQTVDTSAPLEGDNNPTIDPPQGDHDNFPYYDEKADFTYNSKYAEYKGEKQDAYLYDSPSRSKSNGDFTWNAETSLIEKTKLGNNPILTLKWGFNQNRPTPVKIVTPSKFHKNAINQISKRK
jgi:RHS repeat-associated protein